MDDNKFRNGLSSELAGQYMVKAGASASKINIGVANYGRGFSIDQNSQPAPFVPSSGGLSYGTWETNNFDYYDIKNQYMGTNSTSTVYFDNIAKAPFIFDSPNKRFITYEDPRSVCSKV